MSSETDRFDVDLRAHFAEGHPDEEHRQAWLDTLPVGRLQTIFPGRATDDMFWQIFDEAVNEACYQLGYTDPEEEPE
jgi:rhamnogalacturonyl hydrolase YesR